MKIPDETYIEYGIPRKGVFSVTTDEYRFPEGWVEKEEEGIIIGETDDCYVKRLINSGHGEWVDGQVIQRSYIVHVGYHKSRFVRWESTQIELFKIL